MSIYHTCAVCGVTRADGGATFFRLGTRDVTSQESWKNSFIQRLQTGVTFRAILAFAASTLQEMILTIRWPTTWATMKHFHCVKMLYQLSPQQQRFQHEG